MRTSVRVIVVANPLRMMMFGSKRTEYVLHNNLFNRESSGACNLRGSAHYFFGNSMNEPFYTHSSKIFLIQQRDTANDSWTFASSVRSEDDVIKQIRYWQKEKEFADGEYRVIEEITTIERFHVPNIKFANKFKAYK